MIFTTRDDLTKFISNNAKAYKSDLALRTFEVSSDKRYRDRVIIVADARGDNREKIYKLLDKKIGGRIRKKSNGQFLDMKIENWFVEVRQNSYSLLSPRTNDGEENEKILYKNLNTLISVLGSIDLRFRDSFGRIWRPGDKNNLVSDVLWIGRKINKDKKSRIKADVILVLENGRTIPISVKKKNAGRWESADTLFKDTGATILKKGITEKKIVVEKVGMIYRVHGQPGAKATKAEAEMVMFGSDIVVEKGAITVQSFNSDCFHIPSKTNEVYVDCEELIRKLEDVSDDNYPYIHFYNNAERVTLPEFPGIRIVAVPRKKLGPNAIILNR